jgi:hypothetical protein
MSLLRRREIPLILFAVISLPMLLTTYIDNAALKQVAGVFTDWGVIVTLMGLALGEINFIFVQTREIRARRRGMRGELIWPFALYALVLSIVVAVLGIVQGATYGTIVQQGYEIFVSPGLVSIFGSQVIQFIWIAFKRFRITNLETALLYIGAVIGLLFAVPLGTWIWPGFQTMGAWLTAYPASGFARALQMCIAIGSIAFYVRLVLGLETAYLGGE